MSSERYRCPVLFTRSGTQYSKYPKFSLQSCVGHTPSRTLPSLVRTKRRSGARVRPASFFSAPPQMRSSGSKTLSWLGIPHTVGPYRTLTAVFADHFGISETTTRRYVDVEAGKHSFEELAVWLEDCSVFVIDESAGEIQRYGAKQRTRRQVIVSMRDADGAVVRLPPLVHFALGCATRRKARVRPTRMCCRCYGIAFCLGFCLSGLGVGVGMLQSSTRLFRKG